jgi:hypothetical protein
MEKIWQTDNVENPSANSSKRLKKMNLVGMYDWVFSDATNLASNVTVSETIFTMSGTPKSGGGPNAPKPNIVFTNYLLSSNNGTELKFDLDISNFADSWWDNSATGLVVAYRIEAVDSSASVKNVSLKGVSV